MSAITPFPYAFLQQTEEPQQTFERIQTYFNTGGKAQAVISYIADLTEPDQPIEAINRIFSYCLGALKFNDVEKAHRVFEAYLEVNKDCQHLLLTDALKKRQYSLAESLCERGYDPNAGDPNTGATPLHLLVQDGVREAVTWLFAHGALANKALPDGRTALHIAASLKLRAIAEILLDNRADANACAKQEFTPLHYAAAVEDNRALLELLIVRGARLQEITEQGLTALAIAQFEKHEENIRTLIGKRAAAPSHNS
jgi:ankyrin repeat protein